MYIAEWNEYCGGAILSEFYGDSFYSIENKLKHNRHSYAHFIAALANTRDEVEEDERNQNTKYGPMLRKLGFKMIGRERNPNTGNMCYVYMATKEQLKFPGDKSKTKAKKTRKDYWRR